MSQLSIITVNLNNARGLEKTILSVIHQTFRDFEFIVVDGKSTDGSVELMHQHKAHINHGISEPDSGIYHAMNKGIKSATGEYCLFLNSGDYLVDENVLQKMLGQKPTEEIVYGDMIIDSGNGKTEYGKQPAEITFEFMMEATLWHPVSFIRRTLFERLGYYNEKNKIVSDYEFFLRAIIIEGLPTKYIPLPVAVFNLQGIGSSKEFDILHRQEKQAVQRNYFPTAVIATAQRLNALKSSREMEILGRIKRYPFLKKCLVALYGFVPNSKRK